jgi:hypothetical protein
VHATAALVTSISTLVQRRQTFDRSCFSIETSGVRKRTRTTESIWSSWGTEPDNTILQPGTATLLFPKNFTRSRLVLFWDFAFAQARTLYTSFVLAQPQCCSTCCKRLRASPLVSKRQTTCVQIFRWRPPTRRHLSVSVASSTTVSMTHSYQTWFRGSVALSDVE